MGPGLCTLSTSLGVCPLYIGLPVIVVTGVAHLALCKSDLMNLTLQVPVPTAVPLVVRRAAEKCRLALHDISGGNDGACISRDTCYTCLKKPRNNAPHV